MRKGPRWIVLVQRPNRPCVLRWKYQAPGDKGGLTASVASPASSGRVSGKSSGAWLHSREKPVASGWRDQVMVIMLLVEGWPMTWVVLRASRGSSTRSRLVARTTAATTRATAERPIRAAGGAAGRARRGRGTRRGAPRPTPAVVVIWAETPCQIASRRAGDAGTSASPAKISTG